jgi:L-malate glycosyltransferase
LSRIIGSFRPDVVHAHDPHAVAMASMALSFGSRTAGVRLVASRRVDFRLQRHSFSRWKYRQVERFIAASAAIRAILVSDGIPASRIDVVHDGIDVERVARVPAGDIHQTFWFPKGAPVVVNVGALVGHKGQRFLVDAMGQVRRQVPDAQLVIFGEGDLRAPLTRQIRDLGLDKHVVLAGFRDDVHALTRSADLFVMSSVTEGLGSAVLDAMALGLPVVGTRAGGIPEAVEEGVTGLLVPPGRAEALAEAIVRLLNDPAARARFGDAGRARVESEFGVDRLVEGTLASYRHVLERNPTTQAAT